MRTLSSSEFRRTFAKLDEPVTVTVLGRPIATYTPVLTDEFKADRRERTATALSVELAGMSDEQLAQRVAARFRPAPKPTRKR